MKTILKTAAAAVALMALSGTAHAVTYNLGADYSDISNPNSVWSFTTTSGGTLLTHFPQPSGNNLDPAAGNGYWGLASGFNTAPFVIKTTANGASISGYTNNDFLLGDVILHSPNPGGGYLAVTWTAPSAGSIVLNAASWYAHSPVTRSNDVSLFFNSTSLGSAVLNNANNRSQPLTASLATNVLAGDVLSFRFSLTAGQSFGSLAGLSENIDFTPTVVGNGTVPEPATWATMLAGFALMGMALRRSAKVTTRVRFS